MFWNKPTPPPKRKKVIKKKKVTKPKLPLGSSPVDIVALHRAIDKWHQEQLATRVELPAAIEAQAPEKPKRTDGKRAIRTKSTGDRVYLLDDNAKTKAWITSPEVLEKLGFTMAEVQDVEDSSLLGYQMVASIYKVE